MNVDKICVIGVTHVDQLARKEGRKEGRKAGAMTVRKQSRTMV